MITWVTQELAELPASLAWLSRDERARLDTMRVAKRRADYLLGRWTARRALAAHLGSASPAAFAVRAACDGSPEALLDGAPLALRLSISHSAGRALAAVSDTGPLGADLERIEPRSQLLVDDFFTPGEAAQVAACPPAERDRWITVIWSAKESALKARRTGLREDTRHVHVALGAGAAAWRPLRIAVGHGDALSGWWCIDAGFALTIVGAGRPAPITAARA